MHSQVDMFGSFEVGDVVAIRIPDNYPPGPLKAISGTLGVIEGEPFTAPGEYFVRVHFSKVDRPLWSVNASLLAYVGKDRALVEK